MFTLNILFSALIALPLAEEDTIRTERLDEVVVFRSLTREDIQKVIDLELKSIRKRLAAKRHSLSFDDEALAFILDRAYSPEFGAREVRRVVMRYVEDALAEVLLAREDAEKPAAIFGHVASDNARLNFAITAAEAVSMTENPGG